MRKRLLFVGLCTAAVLSFTACAGAESNGKEVETQKVEDAVRSMEEAATQEPETIIQSMYITRMERLSGLTTMCSM